MEKTAENQKLIKEFLIYVVKELKIKSNAKIIFLFEGDPSYPSAGGYYPNEKEVVCAVKNRALADIMRTLAHELTHHKQNELGKIGPSDTDNQVLEDEANIMSGRFVRWFGRTHREIYADIK
jgi:Zn-dependent peptidase ImmA (M78 family)